MADSKHTAVTRTQHGIEFQKFITTLFSLAYIEEVKNERLEFKITPEDTKSGKFDDIRYEYKYKNDVKENVFLVQAKHSQTSQSTIKLHDFIPNRNKSGHEKFKTNSKDQPFLIQTYFTSFYDLKISETDMYRLLLCTNRNIDNDANNMWNLIEDSTALDKHLLGLFKIVEGKCYKLNHNNVNDIESIKILKTLLGECSESSRLAKLLVDHIQYSIISDRRQINRHNDLFAKYRNALVNIIDNSAGNDMARFKIDNFKKSGEVFIREFEKHYRSVFGKDGEIEVVWDHLQQKVINVAARYMKEAHESESTFPNDEVQEEDIKNFFKCFRLVCGIVSCNDVKETIENHLRSCDALPNNKMVEDSMAVGKIHAMVSDYFIDPGEEILNSRNVIACLDSMRLSTDFMRKEAVNRYKHFKTKSLFRISERDLKESELYKAINDYGLLKLNTREIKYGATILYDIIEKKGKIHKCLFFEFKDFLLNPKMFSNVFISLKCPVCLFIVNTKDCVEEYNVNYLENVTNINCENRVFLIHETKNPATNSTANESTVPQFNTKFYIGNLSTESQTKLFNTNYALWDTLIPAVRIFQNNNFLIEDVIEQITHGKEMEEHSYIKKEYEKMEKTCVHRKRRQSNMQETSIERKEILEILKLIKESEETKICGKQFVQNKTVQEMCKTDFLVDQQKNHDGETNGEDKTSKVIILLHEEGYGKTVYLQWLAGDLRKKDKYSLITFYNLSNYNTIFEYKSNDGQDTTYLRILFLMIYFSKSPFQSKSALAPIMPTIEYISFSGGKIVLNQDFEKDLTFDCVTFYKVFEEKFNTRKLMILVDGLDEVGDSNKGFYYKLLYRFAQFEGVSRLYVTSPLNISQQKDFKDMFKTGVSVATYQLQPLSLKEKYYILRTALESQFKCFVIDEEKKHVLFTVMCSVIISSFGETSNNLSILLKSVAKFNKPPHNYINDDFMIDLKLLRDTVIY